jgi:hypothetical protein
MIDSTGVSDVKEGINLAQAAFVAVSTLVSFILGLIARRKK